MLYYMSNIMVEKMKVLGPGYVIEFKNIHINSASIFFPKMTVNVARKESGNFFQVQDVMNHSNVCFP